MQLQTKPQTDLWIATTWSEFLQVVDDPAYAKAKGYYFDGQMRVETKAVGANHARTHGIVCIAIALFCALKGLPIKGLVTCSYRKSGVREAQPDISYYIGEHASSAPQGGSITNLDETSPPDLAIEIVDSSLEADLGKKRLLYEDLQVAEYWVVDVENAHIIAFQVVSNGSKRIDQSQVLAGLDLAVLNEAIALSRSMDDGQVVAWLMTQFQS